MASVGGVDFNNVVFRNRIITDALTKGEYRKILYALYTKTNQDEKGGTYLGFGLNPTWYNTTTNTPKLTNYTQAVKQYDGQKDAIRFTMTPNSLKRPVVRVGEKDDEMIYRAQNEVFTVLSDALYEGLLRDAIKAITETAGTKLDTTELEAGDGQDKIITKIKKVISEKFLKAGANQMVMNQQTANKLSATKDVTNRLSTYQFAQMQHESFQKLCGLKTIILQDTNNILKDFVFIMRKDDGFLTKHTAFRAFLLDGYDNGIRFRDGEYGRYYPTEEVGLAGGGMCQFSVICDLKTVDKSLAHVIKTSKVTIGN